MRPGSPAGAAPWWRSAVIYEVYIRSFADGSGDGVDDVAGLRSRLSYLAGLGVDAVWITPWYPSPMRDGGYDVADLRGIDARFGTLAEARDMIDEAHALGLRVLLDLVPNHLSDRHPWFQQALAAAPGSPERARFIFRDGRGRAGAVPPNDWTSNFGGGAWTRVTEPDGRPGQWYLHLFTPAQPDLDWTNPEVREEFAQTLRFWFGLGVDGFRIDVAHGLAKAAGLPDLGSIARRPAGTERAEHPYWDRDEVHEIYRSWRTLADAYTEPRDLGALQPRHGQRGLAVRPSAGRPAAAPTERPDRSARRSDDRPATGACRRAADARAARWRVHLPGRGAGAGRGRGPTRGAPPGSGMGAVRSRRPRPRRLPRPAPVVGGRTAVRIQPPGAGAPPWLPQPACWRRQTVESQTGDPGSTLELYRRALRLRRTHPALGDGTLGWLAAPTGALAFARDPGFACVVNLSADPVAAPRGELAISSEPLERDGRVPADTAAWFAV